MKLEYRILWFDDQKTNVEHTINRISSMISRLGFEPSIDFRIVNAGVADPLAGIPDEDEVDLVMMDWKLGGQHDGAKLTRRLRQKYQNTDVVFYSSESPQKLRRLIFDEGIDGVFCSTRDRLSERVGGIIQGQLRRVLDLDHMRGIVMAATSDLDHEMIECLELIGRISYSGKTDALSASIAESIVKSMNSKIKEISKLGEKGQLSDLLREPTLGSFQRLNILMNEITNVSDRLSGAHVAEQLSNYHGEILTPRNDFAHRKAERKEGKMVLEGRDKPYDQDAMRELRLRLLSHSDNLRELLASLEDMADVAGEPELAAQLSDAQDAVAATAESLAKGL